jgi:uncharacterized damage-inducible protein DinB
MSERAEALAAELERVNAALEREIERCSDEDWRRTCAGEGWSVGVAAHHVAVAHESILGLVQAVAHGQPVPPITAEMLDGYNAQHAVEHANCTRDEVLDLHRRGARAAADAVRGLSDEQLDRAAPVALLGGAPASAQQLIESGLIGHPKDHLASIRAAVGRQG